MKVVEVTYRYEVSDAVARSRPRDAEAARDRLNDGSRTIAALLDSLAEGTGTVRRVISVDPRDLGLAPGGQPAPTQRPYAAVLGCSDARVPIELIFNEGPNDLFVVRVAGNGLGSEVLGSLKYARDGETDGGGAWIGGNAPAGLSGSADRGGNRVERATGGLHGAAGDRKRRSARVSRAAYGVYLLTPRQVWARRSGSAECAGLADPPVDQAAFEQFTDAVVQSDRIAALLAQSAE